MKAVRSLTHATKRSTEQSGKKKGTQTRGVLQGAPLRGRQLYLTFPGAPDPLFKASKAPFLTLRVATPSGAPRQAPLDKPKLFGPDIFGWGGCLPRERVGLLRI